MDGVRRARRSLLVFFLVLVPLTALVEGLKIAHVRFLGSSVIILLLMWVPALASFVARLALREGFGDISLRLGGARGVRAILAAIGLPLLIGAVAYGVAWAAGIATFAPPDGDYLMTIPATTYAISGSPLVRFAKLLLTHLTIGAAIGAVWAAGEELGWRGYLVQRMRDARVPWAVPLSALIWALWHWPLLFAYADPASRILALLVFTVVVLPIGCFMARQRLETGSVWPAIVFHAVWNDVIGLVFTASTPDEGIWLGETGILVAAASVLILGPLLLGRWTVRAAGDDRAASASDEPDGDG